MKISATIITFNEEKVVEKCIKALKNIVDEIIVVDSFSTDNTVVIADKHGAKVFKNKFLGYSSQKKFAISKTSYDWILSIDADEEINKDLATSISLVKSQQNHYDAYFIKRKNMFQGKFLNFSGLQGEKLVRLFNKKKCFFSDREIHEVVQGYDNPHTIKKGFIIHHTYKDVYDRISIMNKYSEMMANEYHKENKKSNLSIVIIKSIFGFIKPFFLGLGFLDGKRGFYWACLNSLYSFVKYIKLEEKNNIVLENSKKNNILLKQKES